MEGVIARKGLSASIATAVAIGLALLVPAGAIAHKITGGPTITGIPQETQTLTASATWSGDPADYTATWKWQRCLATAIKTCTAIPGATANAYVVATADVGFVLRVRVTVTHKTVATDSVNKRSAPTPVIQPKAAPPPPVAVTPEPDPEPEDPPHPVNTPFNPPSDPAPGTPPPVVDGLRVMDPFPTVRISGRLTGWGADVTRLSVRAPRGASISVRCRGGSCPARTFARAARVKRLAAYERHLRAGTKLDVVSAQARLDRQVDDNHDPARRPAEARRSLLVPRARPPCGLSDDMSTRLLDERGRPTRGAWRVLVAGALLPFGVAFAVTVAAADDEAPPAPRPVPTATVVEEPSSGTGIQQPARLRAAARLPKPPPPPRPKRARRRAAPPAPVIVRAAPAPRPAPRAAAPAPAPAPYVAPAPAPRPAAAPAPAPQETFDSAGSFESEG